MEECCKANHIYIIAFLTEFSKFIQYILLGFWLSNIICHLMFFIFPVICDRIIHMHRIPDHKSQKAYSISMIRNCIMDDNFHCFFIIIPVGHHFICCTVNNFPPSVIIFCVWLKLILIKVLHDFNSKFI